MDGRRVFGKRYGEEELLTRHGEPGGGAPVPFCDIERRVKIKKGAARAAQADAFIAAVRLFSEEYEVSADIMLNGCGVEAWLYFAEDVVSGPRKRGLIALAAMADEAQIIPRTGNMPSWCSFALVLTYMTHRIIVEKE